MIHSYSNMNAKLYVNDIPSKNIKKGKKQFSSSHEWVHSTNNWKKRIVQ